MLTNSSSPPPTTAETTLECPVGHYHCTQDDICIFGRYECDGVKDCPSGQDENATVCGLDPCDGDRCPMSGRCASKASCLTSGMPRLPDDGKRPFQPSAHYRHSLALLCLSGVIAFVGLVLLYQMIKRRRQMQQRHTERLQALHATGGTAAMLRQSLLEVRQSNRLRRQQRHQLRNSIMRPSDQSIDSMLQSSSAPLSYVLLQSSDGRLIRQPVCLISNSLDGRLRLANRGEPNLATISPRDLFLSSGGAYLPPDYLLNGPPGYDSLDCCEPPPAYDEVQLVRAPAEDEAPGGGGFDSQTSTTTTNGHSSTPNNNSSIALTMDDKTEEEVERDNQ